MPYNTRRKSLSLPSLGIQLPNSARPHRYNSKPDTPEQLPNDQSPPAKRVKREHNSLSPLPSPRRSPSTDLTATKTIEQKPQLRAQAHTPPPSPSDVALYKKIDLDGIGDDVVVSCIEQLEKTGNRPHLIKELATVLLTTNRNIANSANPAALLSSRLTQYMKRPWTALSPCPIAKELIPVHPRKVFFFLTTQPRGELPQNSDDILPPFIADTKRLTPSISDPSVNDEEEATDRHERMRFSPSPEVDLFSPELHTTVPVVITPGSSYSSTSSHISLHEDTVQQARTRPSQRAPSPGLEADERGFTETASAVRQNRLMQQTQSLQITAPIPIEEPRRTEQELSMELFGRSHSVLNIMEQKHMMSSPMIAPKHNMTVQVHDIDMDLNDASWNIKSPEHTSFDELDQMFDDF